MDIKDLFLSGKLNDLGLLVLGGNSANENKYNEYQSFRPTALPWKTIDDICQSNSQLAHLKSLWLANIGRNGLNVAIDNNFAEATKERLKNKMYNFVYSDLEYNSLRRQIVSLLFTEGNAIIEVVDNKPVVKSIRYYKIEHNKKLNITRYKLKDSTGERGDWLYHGKDIWHIKDPIFEDYAVAPSRLDLAYSWLTLESHGVKTNSNIFARGAIGLTILSLDPQSYRELEQSAPNAEGENALQQWLKETWSNLTGSKNANTIRTIPKVDNVYEIGKNNKDMQFNELLRFLTPERVSWSWGITLADLGSGEATTYNNTQTFSYVLYEKIGRHIEQQIDSMLNTFLLPAFNLPTSVYGEISVTHVEPSSPDRTSALEQARQNWLSDTITLNEYRDYIDMPPVDDGDVYYSEWRARQSSNVVTQEAGSTQPDTEGEFKKKIYKKTPIEKVLESELVNGSKKKKGFIQKWEKAFDSQLTDWLAKFKSDNPEDPSKYKVELPKIESYYSFPALEKDLAKFAQFGVDEFNKDKNIKFKKVKYAESGLPKIIQKALEFRVLFLLKGEDFVEVDEYNKLIPLWMGIKKFKGVDEETSSQISNFLKARGKEGVPKLVNELTSKFKDMTTARAETIARTEVSNALEGSRYILYQDEYGKDGTSRWSTAKDERVGDDHEQNEGVVRKLGKAFPSGETRPGQRPNCRCTSFMLPPGNY